MIISTSANFSDTEATESFYKQILPVIESSDCGELCLDFSRVGFFTPEAVLSLICTARLWHHYKNSRVSLILQPEVYSYFERINLFQVCQDYLTTPALQSPPEFAAGYNQANAGRTFLEVTPVSSEPEKNASELYQISDRAKKILTSWALERVSPIVTLLHEVIENVMHSGDKGFVFMQRRPDRASGGGSRIQIGIADLGIGIQASLETRYPNLGGGSAYLAHAVRAGVTSRPEGDVGGLGLYNVHKILQGGMGKLIIRSNSSMLLLYEGRNYPYDNLAAVPGTQIYITIWGRHLDWQQLLPTN